ncbi:hypothetical protein JDV02_005181 [Purpureocillium takamizusanense]|uniref:Uncharacterized protein n=1 Tax=Purpureocillium takamizusanense TaxID=2060973 RepID=A0A9Q8QHW6_9HYPO|nr:uncharacterized protein JDV02_005181 [Purpureocillium takamizusanense]UNI18952.1 hypothetical protein JDV02_005181 [Purpureocillium takamizusanense]
MRPRTRRRRTLSMASVRAPGHGSPNMIPPEPRPRDHPRATAPEMLQACWLFVVRKQARSRRRRRSVRQKDSDGLELLAKQGPRRCAAPVPEQEETIAALEHVSDA